MPRGGRSLSVEGDEEMTESAAGATAAPNETDGDEEDHSMHFTQQCPEMSQPILATKMNEKTNLDNLGSESKHKIITDLSRLILFKALAGEPIDRTKCLKEVIGEGNKARIGSAAFEEAATNLRNVFGFDICRVPKFMETIKNLPAKYKDRYFVINQVDDDDAGTHSKEVHSIHTQSSIEKGFLMVVLAFCYCKGNPKPDGSRWIWETDLYRLLHGVDENLPSEPPEQKRRHTQSSQANSRSGGRDSQTPDVDMLLDKFVKMDYLLRDTQEDKKRKSDNLQIYSLGPRAAMEIGRGQIIYFCAEVLDEDPDPTMLVEIEHDGEDDE